MLRVLYLVFNEGYASSAGPTSSGWTCREEAIRLARIVVRVVPDDTEAEGLLALLLLLDARRPARTTADGDPIPLPAQDRSLWDATTIAEGTAILDRAVVRGRVGEYQLQAAIAAIHDRAPTAEATDWPQIAALYGLLERMTGNPVVTLNRAVAAAMANGPADGLAVLAGVEATARRPPPAGGGPRPPPRAARATRTARSPPTARRHDSRRTSRSGATSRRRPPGSGGDRGQATQTVRPRRTVRTTSAARAGANATTATIAHSACVEGRRVERLGERRDERDRGLDRDGEQAREEEEPVRAQAVDRLPEAAVPVRPDALAARRGHV